MSYTTQVFPGLGTLLKVQDATTPTVFDTISQRVSIDGPEVSVGQAETTNLDSTVETKRPTLPDNGDLSLTIQYAQLDVQHRRLFGWMQAPATVNWQLVFTDGTSWGFPGFCSKFKPTGMEKEGNLTAEITITLTGPITELPS